jgi:hypothetical protein
MPKKVKNPFYELSETELLLLEKDELTEKDLDNLIDLMLSRIKKHYKLKYYQKLYYYNKKLQNDECPPFQTEKTKPKKDKDGKYIIHFE